MTAFRRLLPRMYGGLLFVVAATAAGTAGLFAAAARRTLKVHFVAALHHPLSEAASIWLTNSRASLGVAICVFCIPFLERVAPAARPSERLPFWLCDAILVFITARTAVLAGVLIGAYGAVQLRVFMPDGPIELLAWALLACIYVQMRRRASTARDSATGLLVVEALLALAAVLEACL